MVNGNGVGWLATWKSIILVVLVWVVSLAVQWGLTAQRVSDQDRRIKDLEDQRLTKDQFNEFRINVTERLARIEAKVDDVRRSR